MKKVAVILSGCGVFDGAEIHESVLTLLHIELNGASYQCFAPDIMQHHVINHRTGEESHEQRNVLTESARIARGEIKPLSELDPTLFDALAIPGGFGVAKNISDLAFKGAESSVLDEFKTVCQSFNHAKKPIAYICIAPALIAHNHEPGTRVTIGNDPDTVAVIQALGAEHIHCEVDSIVVDEAQKIISTPAYMLADSITEAHAGIGKAINKLIELA